MSDQCSFSIPVDHIVSNCWDWIVRQASYTRKLEENLKALSVELKRLQARRHDVQRAVDVAENQLMKRLSQVDVWLSTVQDVVVEAEKLIEVGPQEVQKLRFAGCFSRIASVAASLVNKWLERLKILLI